MEANANEPPPTDGAVGGGGGGGGGAAPHPPPVYVPILPIDPALPMPVSSFLLSLQVFIETNGWYVLIIGIVVYVLYRRYRTAADREAVFGAARVQRLEGERRMRRLAQQTAWNAESAEFHKQTARERESARVRAALGIAPDSDGGGAGVAADAANDAAAAAAPAAGGYVPSHIAATPESLDLPPLKPKSVTKPKSAPKSGSSTDSKSSAADSKFGKKKKFGDSKPASGGFRPYIDGGGGGDCGSGRSRWGGGRRGGG